MKIFNTDFRNVSQGERRSDKSNVPAWQKELLFDFVALLKLLEIFRDRFISTALKIMAGSHFDQFFPTSTDGCTRGGAPAAEWREDAAGERAGQDGARGL